MKRIISRAKIKYINENYDKKNDSLKQIQICGIKSKYKKIKNRHFLFFKKKLKKSYYLSYRRQVRFRYKKLKIQWLNVFSTMNYYKIKEEPKEIHDFANIPWGTGSRFWRFFPFKVKLPPLKHKFVLMREKLWRPYVFPRWALGLRTHYKTNTYVPPRYIYIINAFWTPYYITLFYLVKAYTKKPSYYYLAKSFYKKYVPKKTTEVICNFIKASVNACTKLRYNHKKLMYKRLIRSWRWWIFKKWLKKRRYKHKQLYYKRKRRYYRRRNQINNKRKRYVEIRMSRALHKTHKTIALKRLHFLRKLGYATKDEKSNFINDKFFKSWAINKKKWRILLKIKKQKNRTEKILKQKLKKKIIRVEKKNKVKRRRLSRKKKDKKKIYMRKYIKKYFLTTNMLFKDKLLQFPYLYNKYSRLRNAHRYSSLYHTKLFFYYIWRKLMVWFAINKKRYNERKRIFIPPIFRRMQKNPYRYYSISRWNNRASHWISPIMHSRKLFPYKLLHCITRETRHPNRRKRWKVYKWLNYTLHNRWNYGIRAKKNYRLKQILFGRIVLPALTYLKQWQFNQIKKNASHIKPLALANSKTGNFLGKFERRIDILTYKLNFAPTIQWARLFVETGWIYVSYWSYVTKNYNFIGRLENYQKFPLIDIWNRYTKNKFNNQTISSYHFPIISTMSGNCAINSPLPIMLPSYRINLKGMIHWANTNIKIWFYKKLFKRNLPNYFLFNKSQTIGYFWRNLRSEDIAKLKRARIKKNTFTWLI